MRETDYFQKRNIKCNDKIDQLLLDLPDFCAEFFFGIESRTTSLTRMNYAYDLRIFTDFLCKKKFIGEDPQALNFSHLEKVTATDIERFLSYLNHYEFMGKFEQCNERAKARKLATVRSLFKYFFNKDKLSANVAAKIETPKLHDKEIIRLDTNGEVNEVSSLLTTAESGQGLSKKQKDYHKKTYIRDTALLSLFLGTGIRISELIGINLDDVDFSANSFRVTRKGGNRTILYFSDEVKEDLLRYYQLRTTDQNIPRDEQAFFVSMQNKRFSPRGIENLVKKYARIVTPLKNISPHKLRSTYGTALYRKTKDIYVVAEVLGHRDVNTTKKHYAAITDDIRKQASNQVILHENE